MKCDTSERNHILQVDAICRRGRKKKALEEMPEKRAPEKRALFTFCTYKRNLLLRPLPKTIIISGIKETYFCPY